MNRRDFLKSSGGALAAVGAGTFLAEATVYAQNGNCTPPQHFTGVFSGTLPDNCTQQVIAYSVEVKTTVQTCTNADGSATYKLHQQIHGTGQGLDPTTLQPTGTQYVINDQYFDRTVIGPPPTPPAQCSTVSDTSREHLLLISKGNQPNENAWFTNTFTVSSSCGMSFNSTMDIDCHG